MAGVVSGALSRWPRLAKTSALSIAQDGWPGPFAQASRLSHSPKRPAWTRTTRRPPGPAGCDPAAERRRRERTEYLMAFEGEDASIITWIG